jgi:hypothetical protein
MILQPSPTRHAKKRSTQSVLAHITFSPADFSFGLKEEETVWWGRCRLQVLDASSVSMRADAEFLHRFSSNLSIYRRCDGKLGRALRQEALDEKVKAWRDAGNNQPDLLLLRHYSKSEIRREVLDIAIILEERKLAFFKDALQRLCLSPDVLFVVTYPFQGFREPHCGTGELPTRAEFLNRMPYFISGECSITVHMREPSCRVVTASSPVSYAVS